MAEVASEAELTVDGERGLPGVDVVEDALVGPDKFVLATIHQQCCASERRKAEII